MILALLINCLAFLSILVLYHFYKLIENISPSSSSSSSPASASLSYSIADPDASSSSKKSLSSASVDHDDACGDYQTSLSRQTSTMSRSESLYSRVSGTTATASANDALDSLIIQAAVTATATSSPSRRVCDALGQLYMDLYRVYLTPICRYAGLNDPPLYMRPARLAAIRNSNINKQQQQSGATSATLSRSISSNYARTCDELFGELTALDAFRVDAGVRARMRIDETHVINVIVAVDFTASNEWRGRRHAFPAAPSMHRTMGERVHNPYQKVIASLSFGVNKLLEGVDRNCHACSTQSVLGCYGLAFGDASTKAAHCFSFLAANKYTNSGAATCEIGLDAECVYSVEELLARYNEVVKRIELSGPTSFAPIVHKCMQLVEANSGNSGNNRSSSSSSSSSSNSKMMLHLLFIVTDGQLVAGSDEELRTLNALRAAHSGGYPLAVCVVGVGDGPWPSVLRIERTLRALGQADYFHFVDYHEVTRGTKTPDLAFAAHAFAKLPAQCRHMKKANML